MGRGRKIKKSDEPNFTDWIKTQMNEVNLTQEQLAFSCNFSRCKLNRIMRNPLSISMSELKKLSCELGVEIHYFMDMIISFEKKNIY